MSEFSFLDKIKDLQSICKVISILKSQLIEELPHYGHDALYLNNDEITTGLLNNMTEIKVHLVAGQLLYFHNEHGHFIDLIRDNILENLKSIVARYGISMTPSTTPLTNLQSEALSYYLSWATKVSRCLELFRMKLRGHFTQLHLWTHGFDFSVEWFTGKNDEQIGIGISPGDDKYESPYLYVNPYPFKQKMDELVLPIGIWHTGDWNGIKVEWKNIENMSEQEISNLVYDLFLLAECNFK